MRERERTEMREKEKERRERRMVARRAEHAGDYIERRRRRWSADEVLYMIDVENDGDGRERERGGAPLRARAGGPMEEERRVRCVVRYVF